MIASAADHIVARKTSIVGSIGVIFQYPKLDGLLDTLGVDMRAIKSTPLKAEPTFYGDTPPEAEEMIRAMILDSYEWFKEIVAERRGYDAGEIDALADGSVFTGRQASTPWAGGRKPKTGCATKTGSEICQCRNGKNAARMAV
jgi:protease-4